MLTWLQYHKQGEPISFMDSRNTELEGIVDTVHIEIDSYGKRIWYDILFQGENIQIDGITFRRI